MKHQKSNTSPTDNDRLKALFAKNSAGLSQDVFGKKFGIGSQGMVWQYLNNRAPLNVAVAKKFANGLGVSVKEFSPLLAEKIEQEGQGGEVDTRRVATTISMRPKLRGDMLRIYAERNSGMNRVKLCELYEEAIAQFVARNCIK